MYHITTSLIVVAVLVKTYYDRRFMQDITADKSKVKVGQIHQVMKRRSSPFRNPLDLDFSFKTI